MFVLYDEIQKTRILVINVFEYCPRVYIEGGYYFLQGLQLRALLERGFYSREGLIWGYTVRRTIIDFRLNSLLKNCLKTQLVSFRWADVL